jgi:translation initiation factor IF-2
VVVSNDKAARTLAAHRAETLRESRKEGPAKVTLEDLLKKAEEGEKVKLNLIVRSDVGGTLEALRASLDKIDVPGTEVKILHAAVGAITESDITLAHTYGGIVLGFNVRPDSKGRRAADSLGVEIRTYSVIYEALEEVELALRGLLAPTIRELVKGSAKIRETFSIPKIGTIAGCMVIDGTVARPHIVRLLRDGVILWEGRLGSLRRFKDDVKEVNQGYECGMNLEGYNDIKVGDVIETFVREEVSALS